MHGETDENDNGFICPNCQACFGREKDDLVRHLRDQGECASKAIDLLLKANVPISRL